jgi:hypothetical protein
MRRAAWRYDAEARGGVAPVVHQEPPRHGQLATAHRQRALVEIDAQRALHGMANIAERPHVVGQREVAEAGFPLGIGHAFVDDHALVACQRAHEVQDAADRLARLVAGSSTSATTIAPALMNGLRGMPCSLSS